MTDKAKEKAAVQKLYESTESYIKEIAFNRRALEILGEDALDFDASLNEWCGKYYEYFDNMNTADMTMYMMKETVRMLSEEERS